MSSNTSDTSCFFLKNKDFASSNSEEIVKNIVHANESVINNLDGKTIVKEIYVKNKIYNIVVKKRHLPKEDTSPL